MIGRDSRSDAYEYVVAACAMSYQSVEILPSLANRHCNSETIEISCFRRVCRRKEVFSIA